MAKFNIHKDDILIVANKSEIAAHSGFEPDRIYTADSHGASSIQGHRFRTAYYTPKALELGDLDFWEEARNLSRIMSDDEWGLFAEARYLQFERVLDDEVTSQTREFRAASLVDAAARLDDFQAGVHPYFERVESISYVPAQPGRRASHGLKVTVSSIPRHKLAQAGHMLTRDLLRWRCLQETAANPNESITFADGETL